MYKCTNLLSAELEKYDENTKPWQSKIIPIEAIKQMSLAPEPIPSRALEQFPKRSKSTRLSNKTLKQIYETKQKRSTTPKCQKYRDHLDEELQFKFYINNAPSTKAQLEIHVHHKEMNAKMGPLDYELEPARENAPEE